MGRDRTDTTIPILPLAMEVPTNMCGSMRQTQRPLQSHGLMSLMFSSSFNFSLSLLRLRSLWPPPLDFWPLFLVGQFLNFRVYQLLGEAGTYYGVRFGKIIPWVPDFTFGYIKDPQYVGSIMSLFACPSWVPCQYILLWCLGYVFMMCVQSKEDPSTRAIVRPPT